MSGSPSPTESTAHSEDFSVISTQEEGSTCSATTFVVHEETPDGQRVSSKPSERDNEDATPEERLTSLPTSWMIREVLDTIFSFLVPPYGALAEAALQGKPYNPSGDRATLLSAALTCRTISEAAQTALWNTMDSFAPIIPLLPLMKVDNKYKFSDDSVHDSRPLEYPLSRIRKFIFDKTEGFMSNFAVQMAFGSIAPILFPNLSQLIIPKFGDGLSPEQRVFLPCLLASPLRDVVVGDIHHSETFEAFTSVLALRAQDTLQSISCSWDHLPRAITTLTSLHTVVLTGSLTNQNSIITDLSKCTSLRRLELFLSQDIPGIFLPLPTAPFFPELEDLTVAGDMLGAWRLMKSLTTCHLQTLRFRPKNWSHKFGQLLECLLYPLVDRPYIKHGQRSLAVLEITYSCTTSVAKGYTLDDEAYHKFLKGLSVLSLVSLELSLPVPLPSTISLEYITSCFPNLHTLYLDQYQRAMAPTFDDLHFLARNAPKLRHLGTRIRTKPINASPRASSHFLETLCVYDSSVEDVWYVTEQLDQSFPYLRKITTTSTTCEAGWKEVEKFLGLCQRSRRRF
ncbi:hypothetical protein BDN72DRAFT_881370 [Pluteus cervinus]|uniref:Uncharacterized protein n=1 Tax=Pluteus cervinus TaxID=181527 RepID=A0ACD3AFI9_9AGAR|nr:hypothetical protein BDN72DRAFT_881370 [Pluteus cervinus]